jgi:hypothetical protein
MHNPASPTTQPGASRRIPQMRDLAERLIGYETVENKSSGAKTPAAFTACDKLRANLASLMGTTGIHALISRALARAKTEVPSLRAILVKADGSLAGVDELGVQATPEELAGGSVVLVAQLLSLLVAFVGAELTLQMVREAWPKLSLKELEFGTEV